MSQIKTTSATYDETLKQFIGQSYIELSNGVCVISCTSAPTDYVAGTGLGTAAHESIYIKTDSGPIIYVNEGTALSPDWHSAGAPTWTAPGEPSDIEGEVGDYYENTTAYGSTPATAFWICLGGFDWWQLTALVGSGAPVNHVAGTGGGYAATGSMAIDSGTAGWYINVGTAASPDWAKVTS